MHPIWKGVISFGLVTIPVQLYSATQERGVRFHQVHARDGARVRRRAVCEAEGAEIPTTEIAKAYEAPDGRMVQLTDGDMAALPLPTRRVIDVVAFAPAAEIDPLQLSRAYYVKTADEATAAKPYELLRRSLERSDRVAVAKVALRTREQLAVLRVRENVLVLQTLLWPDEIRSTEGLAAPAGTSIRPAELEMAGTLMDQLGEADLASFTDDYRRAVEDLVSAKLAGTAPEEAAAAAAPENVIDLMAALEASVKSAREGRGDARRKRVAAKRAPAKKSKKAGAGKDEGKKPATDRARKSG